MIIGLTGSIATGKSTVANELMKRGFTVIDADQSAKKVVEPGQEASLKIREVFGNDFFLENGELDRVKMGNEIFSNPDQRQKLNEIVHPAVRQDMLRQKDEALASGKTTIFLDIPLLFESELQWMVEKILVVYAEAAVQKKRLMDRNGYSEQEALDRIQSQIPAEKKKQLADAFLDNSGSLSETIRQLDEVITQWDLQP
ncbi:dephospho-CoA kinase [Jeotgalibacillus sp. R-1-5s-1]|uniref:dephospho-CoA kinase n=1 Tax=Jeotgalibacillus sp. R-1-5s-1 TaxID=2555897 RepID=UPI00106A74E0|nr:dephospho-CoA kinase [Jeotgalibacillus sp. R-1-5s-1]TFD92483.1 dephospho-CoA kinase [Jeotgalibacillus sp. R-1-5s-1]